MEVLGGVIPSSPAGRVALTAVLLILTLGMALAARSLTVDHGAESMVPSGGEDLEALHELNADFGSDEGIVVALHAPDLFSAENLARIDALSQELAALPHVESVLGPTTVQDVEGDELGPYRTVPYNEVLSGELSSEALGRRLATHPLFGGLLVGRGDPPTTAALLVDLEPMEGDPSPVVRQVRRTVAAGTGGLETYVAGMPVERADLAASVLRDQRTFAPLIFALLGATTFILYRYLAGTLVPMAVVAVSLVWTLGVVALVAGSLNPVTSLVTPVVMVVSIAGALHLMNHFLQSRADGLSRHDAVRAALRRTRVPCLNAALTTAFGLVSLWVLPIPAVRGFGLFSAAGVMLAYVLTMTMAPLFLLWLPDPPPRLSRSLREGRTVRTLDAGMGWVARNPGAASLIWIAVLAAAALGASRLRVETDIIRSLSPSSRLYRATRFIDANLTGVNSMEILVRGVDPADPAGLQRVGAFEREIADLEGVRKVIGLPDLAARVNRAYHEGDPAAERVPSGDDADEALADILWLLQEQAPRELRRMRHPEDGTLRITARVTALDTASSQSLFEHVHEAAARHDLDDVSLTGNFVIFSNMSTTLVRNQLRGIALALGLILLALVVQFRSLRLGLLGLIPTAAPILIVYGLMGWAGIPLSVPTAMIACVALGMTVDGTIHLLARLREVFDPEEGYLPALRRTLGTTGRANVFASVALSLGFCVGALSSFEPSVHFALLTGASLLFGLAGVLLLLPLLLVRFHPLGAPAGDAAARRATVGTAIVALAIVPLLQTPSRAADAPALRDQYGDEDSLEAHRGQTILLLYGQPSGLRRMKAWEDSLTKGDDPGFIVLRGLDAREARGKKTEEEVRDRLQHSVPEEIRLLIDWEGALADLYDFPEDEKVAVIVIDSAGRSCGLHAGSASSEAVDEVRSVLARAVETGNCP